MPVYPSNRDALLRQLQGTQVTRPPRSAYGEPQAQLYGGGYGGVYGGGYGGYGGYGYQPSAPYQYTPGALARSPVGSKKESFAELGAGLGTQLAPTIARNVALSGVRAGASPLSATIGAGGLGTAAGLGVGLGTEIVGGLLKPKVQQATSSEFDPYTSQYRRRLEGSGEGVLGGAVKWGGRGAQVGSVVPGIGTAIGAGIGALGGAIGNLFTKNAPSAYSDFKLADAQQAMANFIRQEGGREPLPGEIDRLTRAQGWEPGDRWVGEKGLYETLGKLKGQFGAERAGVGAGAPALPGSQGQFAFNPATGRIEPTTTRITGYTGGQFDVPTNATPAQVAGGPAPATTAAQATPLPANKNWDTDKYAAPQYIAQRPTAQPPPGFSSKKWNDPNHQTPKYVVGRILSQFPPRTENVPAAVAEIQKAYPGARQVGNGKVSIPGVGTMDILVGANVGGKRWHAGSAGPKKGGGAAAAEGGGGAGQLVPGLQADITGGNTLADIIKQIQALSGGGSSLTQNRDALMAALRG